MKLLIIDEEFPFPLNTGKRIRSFNLARELAKFHDITYLAYGAQDSPAADFMKSNRLSPVAVTPPNRKQSGIRFYLRLLFNLFSQYPYIVTSHYTERFKNKLQEILRSKKYDCIICEWTPYAIYLKDISGIKKIIVAHNIESSIWRGYQAETRNPIKKAYIAIQADKVERFERQCFQWSDGATAVSREEAEIIKGFGMPYPVEVIDNGVDVEYFKPQADHIDGDALVFTASMDWRPNQDAVRYFVHAILPLVKKRRPNIKTFIVGRNPTREIMEFGKSDGFTVTGTVDDVRPFVANAGLCIVPLRIGGGSRLKILEAMAMGKAVVSTTIGAEGLKVEDGVNIKLGDSPRDFAEAIVACLEDKSLRNRIATNAREVVDKCYRWEQIGEKYNLYLMSVINCA